MMTRFLHIWSILTELEVCKQVLRLLAYQCVQLPQPEFCLAIGGSVAVRKQIADGDLELPAALKIFELRIAEAAVV